MQLAVALALGVAMGFVLQRGGFCGASLFSLVVLERDWRGMRGVGVAILVSMLGFALLGHLGLVVPNPNPMRLASALVGGTVFGVGMVLAGGCVTGTVYKAAEGRLTSMIALLGIGVGGAAFNDGVLAPAKIGLVKLTREYRWSAGLHQLLDLSYATLAASVGLLGLLLLAWLLWRKAELKRPQLSWLRLRKGAWSPAAAGFALGLLACLAYLSSSAAGRNYPLGGVSGVRGAFSWLVSGEPSGSTWVILLVAGLAVGSAISAALRGSWKLRSADPATLLVALLGGILVGAGATIGRGCFFGNIVSGLALLSIHSALFALCAVLANWAATLLYLRGLR